MGDSKVFYLFSQDGYHFWRDYDTELWNVTKDDVNGLLEPPHCAYRLEYIAKIKGVKV